MTTSLCNNIDWVGYVDREIRDFHGYRTERGSTYNAYLVRDEKIALIDTVKSLYADRLLEHVSSLADPLKIDYVVCNHAEPDHSGSLPAIMEACTNAELVCDTKCKDILGMHYDTEGWSWRVVADGDTISLGKRTLSFLETPMVHWPESMFTYVPEERLLFSMDAFGQHYASDGRSDDEEPLDDIMAEAKTYFANIVMLYGKPIAKVLERASALDIEMIAPSHGIIWRKNLGTIISAYKDWVTCKPVAKVLVVYDTMWKSTQIMAEAIAEGVRERDIDVRLLNVRKDHMTEVATETLDAAAIAFGSPTLNTTLMPQMAAVLTYLKGLRPAGKAGFAFGSYGWARGGPKAVENYMQEMKFEILREPLESRFVPSESVLADCREAGNMLAEQAEARI